MTLSVHLHRIGTTNEVDVTRFLSQHERIVVTEWVENRAFERKHGDLHLKLSNLHGFFSSLFADTIATTRWNVYVRIDGAMYWRGEISTKSLTFGLNDRWCEFDAFSKTKWFWEYAKTIKPIFRYADQPIWYQYESGGYITINNFFFVLMIVHNLWRNQTLFTQFNPTTYAGRKLRGVSPQNPPIGNEGRLVELDPNMSLADLMSAMQQYYNAEFYVDHASGELRMQRRLAAKPNTLRNIDSILADDTETTVTWLDENKVDYVYVYSFTFAPAPVETERIAVFFPGGQGGLNQLTPGLHRWRIVGYQNGNPILMSSELAIDLPAPPPGNTGWWVTIRIPQFASVVNERRIFRMAPGMVDFRRLGPVFDNSGVTEYQDRYGIQLLANGQPMPSAQNTFNVYRRYDETTGSWLDDIIDTGNNRPEGNIYEIRPKVRFTEIGLPNLRDESPYDIWAFFGKEQDLSLFRDNWIDWFRTKRKVRCKVRGLDLKVLDEVESGRFPNDLTPVNHYTVRKVEASLLDEESVLELVSV